MEERIIMYTDGSSRGNPGSGGYAVILQYKSKRKEISKGFRWTTNNRMELWAIIAGLKEIKQTHIPIDIYSDSKYVVDSISKKWLDNWIKNGFKGGKKNKDLWLIYDKLSRPFTIKLHWVKGHNNIYLNERCDALATEAADNKEAYDIDAVYEKETTNIFSS